MGSLGILWPLIRILLDTVVLRIVAAVVPGLRIDGWSTALTAVFIMTLASWLTSPLLQFLPDSFLLFVLLEFVFGTVMLGFASLMLNGMEVRGFGALIIAGLLMTFLNFAPFVLGPYLLRDAP
jgi:putative membrane protein